MYVIYKGHNLEFQAQPWEAQKILLEVGNLPTWSAQRGKRVRIGKVEFAVSALFISSVYMYALVLTGL